MENNSFPLGQRKINDLVSENYVYASVLYYFGVGFYNYEDKTLREVCDAHGLKLDQVVQSLANVTKKGEEFDLFLLSYPVPLVIEYLKHTHHVFVKKKLPFIAQLINHIQDKDKQMQALIEDLKFVFPLFVEDFIHHIYKEEDTFFTYILELDTALKGNYNPGKLFFNLNKHSLQRYAIEHDVHDDEMEGIRNITNNYQLTDDMSLELRVLYSELQHFEQMLIVHAKVENEILFPKALELERRAQRMLDDRVKLN